MAHPRLLQARSNNRYKPCAVSGCTTQRKGISNYCNKHSQLRNLHGDPLAHSLEPATFKHERKVISDFFAANKDHAGIKAAEGWLSDWLSNSCVDQSLPSAHEMRRLFDAGVSGLGVLIEVVAVWLYSRRNPWLLPDGLRLTYAIGHAVLRLAPKEQRTVWRDGTAGVYSKRIASSHRRIIGERIRLTLVRLMVGIELGLAAQANAHKTFEQSLATPFDLPKVPA